MLSLFMQVPKLVRSRLAKRCKEVYEVMHTLLTASDDALDEEDVGEEGVQVGALGHFVAPDP
jgi:hypothetical protein